MKKIIVKKLARPIIEGVDPLIAAILSGRGLVDPSGINAYLNGGIELLYDPMLLKNAQAVCEQIERAIVAREQIAVYGDYDADGICATAIMCLTISELGGVVGAKLPDRVTNGYGLSKNVINDFSKRGVKLIVTVDNGITAIDEIAYARSLGIKTVVTDHHQPGKELPICEAIVNPHVNGETYPYPHLAGAGVAFKIACLLYSRAGYPADRAYRHLDLAAIGTIADVVPLTDENRIIAKEGVSLIRQTPRPGIEALFGLFSTNLSAVTSGDIAYKLAPAINATGRIVDNGARKALSLLVSDETNSSRYANELYSANKERKLLVDSHLDRAKGNYDGSKVFVYYDPNIPEGIAGLIAGKLKEDLARPVIVLAEGVESFKGSGRSVQGFNLIEALRHSSGLLTRYGGHPLAAGLSAKKDLANVDALRKVINDYADETGFDASEPEVLTVDAVLPQEKVSLELAQRLSVMEPFGEKNPKPVFLVKGFKTSGYTYLSDKKHLKLFGDTGSAIAFGMASEYEALGEPKVIDLAVTVGINNFNCKADPQLEVVSFAKL